MKLKDLLKDAYSDGMSIEDIELALENIELPADLSAEVDKLKNALSKSNSEAADYKRQLKEKMSAEELKVKEDADKWAEMEEKYNALLKKDAISTNKARLLALGYAPSSVMISKPSVSKSKRPTGDKFSFCNSLK